MTYLLNYLPWWDGNYLSMPYRFVKWTLLVYGLTLVLSCTKYNDRIEPSTGESREEYLQKWIYWDARMFAYKYLNEGDAERIRDSMVFTYPILGPAPDMLSFKTNVLNPLALEAFRYVYFLWRLDPDLWKGRWFVFDVTFIDGTNEKTFRFRYELVKPFFDIPASYYR